MAARFDRLDAPAPLGLAGYPHPVTHRRDIAGVLALLQPAAQVAGQNASIGLDGEKSRLGADDQAGELFRGHFRVHYGLGVGVGVAVEP